MLMTRRTAIKFASTAFAVPFVYRLHAAAPSETLRHASAGSAGRALSDIKEMVANKNVKLVAVCDVDSEKLAKCKAEFPHINTYADWREMLDKEKGLDSIGVGTPDHMHAPIGVSAMNRGIHVYGQKPLTSTVYEARRMAEIATAKKLVTQMGIQIHSHSAHKSLVKLVQSGVIGKVNTVYSWIGKGWGDASPRPEGGDEIPATFNWDHWLGVAAVRPYIGGKYYHPENWRKRLDFGTGTFGDMGCHLLDPVFSSLLLTAPTTVKCTAGGVNAHNWGPSNRVEYSFPGTAHTTEKLALYWSDGDFKPPETLKEKLGSAVPGGAGSLYFGEKGVIHSPYIGMPVLLPKEKFADVKIEKVAEDNHYFQYIDAVRGMGTTSTPFSYGGNLTESVLLGGVAMRFLNQELTWDAKNVKVTNVEAANKFVKPVYRKGWEVEGIS
ncbi:Gfo/Idh/MocA family oxidoreductase [soil metagenome]